MNGLISAPSSNNNNTPHERSYHHQHHPITPILGQILFDNPVVESADEDGLMMDDDDDDGDDDKDGRGEEQQGRNNSESEAVRAVREQEENSGGSSSRLQDPIYFLTSTVSRNWEYVNVSLTRVPGYGFGIAVSGGCDNPHFANGDPAIAISDVLKNGPAQGKLQINDRIISANNISLDNVEYATAVQILRDSGPTVSLRVRRRISPTSYKTTIPINPKRLKKLSSYDSLGFSIAVTLQIKSIDPDSSLGLREGDIIDKIQGLRVNDLFNEKIVVKEIRRVLEETSNNGSSPPSSSNGLVNLNLTVKRTGSNRGGTTAAAAASGPAAVAAAAAATTTTINGPPIQQNGPPIIHHQPQSSIGNLYVQPPTRNPGNKSFDSTILPPPPPPRPPLPQEYESNNNNQIIRSINFIKQNQLGIRLSGGNKSGIIVSAVQKNSQADVQGLQVNDKILRVNEQDFDANPPTREQAINILSGIPNDTLVNLTVTKGGSSHHHHQHHHQDEFFIRTRVGNDDFKAHEVLVVTDSLVNGNVGNWEAYRLDPHHGNPIKSTKMIIPNVKNATELLKKSWKRTTSFRNREFEELLNLAVATEPYDFVERMSLEVFRRVVVVFSPFNSRIMEGIGRIKGAGRNVKFIGSEEDIEFNDGRVRVVKDLVSIKFVQELYEKNVVPLVVFVNFSCKEDLKEAVKGVEGGGSYGRVKKLWGVLGKVYDKLGGYVDVRLEVGSVGEAVEKVWRVVGSGVEGNGGTRICYGNRSSTSSSTHNHYPQSKRPQSASAATTTTRHNNLHPRPSSSSYSNNNKHKSSTDSLISSPPPPPILQFPNFNVPPPCSTLLIEGESSSPHHHHPPPPPPITTTNQYDTTDKQQTKLQQKIIQSSSADYEKRPTLQRSTTIAGIDRVASSQSQYNNHHHHHGHQSFTNNHQGNNNNPVTTTPSNNFAHSPIESRKFTSLSANNTPQKILPLLINSSKGMVVGAPVVDRTKKPSSSNLHQQSSSSSSSSVFHHHHQIQQQPLYNMSGGGGGGGKGKPVPPPKPKIIMMSNGGSANSRSNSRVDHDLDGDNNDLGQTYLNVPMNSKILMIQQQKQQQQQQMQMMQNNSRAVTSGYFDWRGGRLVQKNCGSNNGQIIPIELFVPENAIPVGERVNVWFQIVDYNVREDPSNPTTPGSLQKKMLSPLVKFGPENYRFQIPVEIRIPQYSANSNSLNENNMLAKVLMNNQSDYWTKIDIQNGNGGGGGVEDEEVKIVSLTVQQF